MTGPRPSWVRRVLRARTAAAPPPPDAGREDLPTPVTRERVGEYLNRRGYTYRLDDDGDITGTWDGNRFWFLLLGDREEIVQVRGRWHRPLPPSARVATLQAMNDWNRERIWPKAYVREEAVGLSLYTEVSVDFAHGATDNQLHQMVACGLGTSVQLFASVTAMLPPVPDADDVPDDEGPRD